MPTIGPTTYYGLEWCRNVLFQKRIHLIIHYHKKKQKARVFNVPHTGQKKKSMAFLMAHSILKVLSETLVWMDELIEFHQPTVRCPPTPRSWVSC